jgi:NAD(P)-dependent dehydrogenase (short-subunit alcohol dehydrogenase family)
MSRFEGRGVLVTGGAQGIGKAVAAAFAVEGAHVVILDVDTATVAATADELGCTAVVGDVASRDDVVRAVEAVAAGAGRLDIASVNAAVAAVGPFFDVTDAAWERMFAVNLHGAFRTLQESARAMRDHGGAIVVTTSTNSFWPETGTAPYTSTKYGLLGLVRNAAIDLGRFGVRVNAVAPGIVRTRLAAFLTEDPVESARYLENVPLGRFAEVDDIAKAHLFLASDDASYITGEQLVVDGGVSVGIVVPEPDAPLSDLS